MHELRPVKSDPDPLDQVRRRIEEVAALERKLQRGIATDGPCDRPPASKQEKRRWHLDHLKRVVIPRATARAEDACDPRVREAFEL
ncbi:hypothetical protein C4552_01435 [Candidatus Parcubacteria bacterium]|nr:MAG: hypothetical protein C4552_01435 [Candidatus Parcubacteria bacterium]